MKLLILIIPGLFVPSEVFGVLFIGPCPTISHPNRIANDSQFGFWIALTLPLTNQFPSYLFSTSDKRCTLLNRNENSSLIISRGYGCQQTTVTISLGATENDMILAHSGTGYEKPCLEVTENLRIFQYDDFGFIWTCKEIPDSDQHDIGLLVLFNYARWTLQRSEKAAILNLIEEHFGSDLAESCGWDWNGRAVVCLLNNECGTLAPCRTQVGGRQKYFIVGSFIFLVGLLSVYLMIAKINNNSNRVFPHT